MSMTLTLRLSEELGSRVQRAARKCQVSVNQYVLSTLDDLLAYQEAQEAVEQRLQQASSKPIEDILQAIPDREALPGDEL